MIVKMGIDLARGFEPWKEMIIKNEHRLNEHGGRLVFAGTEKDNDNKLTIIMDFDSPDALKSFAGDEELMTLYFVISPAESQYMNKKHITPMITSASVAAQMQY